MLNLYKPSNQSGNYLPLLCIGLGATVGLSSVYARLLALASRPEGVNGLLAIAFAVLVAILAVLTATIGHVRNPRTGTWIGISFVLVAIGAKFAWQYEYHVRAAVQQRILNNDFPDESPAEIREIVQHTLTFPAHLRLRIGKGWRFNNAGVPWNGPTVYTVWALEVLFFLSMCPIATRHLARQPYCEHLKQWATDVNIIIRLPVDSDAMVDKIRAATTVDALLDLPIPQTGTSNRHAEYRVNGVKGKAGEAAYLSIDLVTLKANKNGSKTKPRQNLVQFVFLTSEQRRALTENTELLTEAIAAYQASTSSSPNAEHPRPATDNQRP